MSTFAARNQSAHVVERTAPPSDAAPLEHAAPPGYTPSGAPPTWGQTVIPVGVKPVEAYRESAQRPYQQPYQQAAVSQSVYVKPSGEAGPTETAASGWMTLLALAAVGGMFFWVTSGPSPRTNP